MQFGDFLGNDALKARLSAAEAQRKLSHCYLICGPAGSGKHTLARQLAAAMQCESETTRPCGHCPACRKVFSGAHPDVITVRDDAHKQLAVDVVRDARADVFVRPNEGRRKVYIISQSMAPAAQNALLKILEEPPAYAAFLLLTENAGQMLATIRSRCAELTLTPLDARTALPRLREQFPGKDDETLTAALLRAGGWLGQVQGVLEGEQYDAAVAAIAAAFADKDALALLAQLVPLERYKREQILPILQQLRVLFARALAAKEHAARPLAPYDGVCAKRRTNEIFAASEALARAIDDVNANVSVGAVVGWLSTRLS